MPTKPGFFMWVQEIQPNSGRHFAEQAHHRVDTEPSPRHIGDLLKPVGWGWVARVSVFLSGHPG